MIIRILATVSLSLLVGCNAGVPAKPPITYGQSVPKWVPLYEGSAINVDVNHDYYPAAMPLSTGGKLQGAQWDGFLKSYVEKFSVAKKDVVLKGMARCRLQDDRVDNLVRFEPSKLHDGPYSSTSYIAIQGNLIGGRADGKLEIAYHGDRYIYANQVIVVADNFRWESSSLRFARAHYTSVVESALIDLNKPGVQQLIRKIISSKYAVIRFVGTPSADITITERMRDDLKSVLDAVNAINTEV